MIQEEPDFLYFSRIEILSESRASMRSSVRLQPSDLSDYSQFESVSIGLFMHQMPANSPPITETMQINSMTIMILITIVSIVARMILSNTRTVCKM